MKFCSTCGGAIVNRVPEGDNRQRHVCSRCQTIHYINPKVVAGCLPIVDGQVLLCRRAINPRKGLWTLPAGFLELGETSAEGAVRETWEEACARAEIDGLYTVFNLPHISQIYMFFRAHLTVPEYRAGEETLEAGLFDESDIPWSELAFPVITRTLEHYFADRSSGDYPVRMEDIRFPDR